MSSKTEVQVGARVDRDLKADFKRVVKHEYGTTRGPLGDAIEAAMKQYVTMYFVREADQFEEFIEESEEPKAEIESRFLEYFDEVGVDLVDTSKQLERAVAPAEGAIEPLTAASETSNRAWYQIREQLFGDDEVTPEDVEKVARTIEKMGGPDAIKELLDVDEELENDE
jgi:hypothetical protein